MTDSDQTLPCLGRYQLLRLLGQGGMADIYLAREVAGPRSSRDWTDAAARYVAVKVLNSERAADPEACALFQDEARLVGMLAHFNLAGIYEVDVDSGTHFVAMEYVHGADLREVLEHAATANVAIPYDTALSIVMGAAAGLDHAHRLCGSDGTPLDLVHRDVSLSNIMVGHDGSVKVIDFGIAQSAASLHATNPGVVRGKASYMSPEQCFGDRTDLRTDVFALGIVLYELTTGRRCFGGGTDFERMLAVVRGDWTPPSAFIPTFPHALERVIRTALAPDPAHRYATAAAMIEELEAVAALEGWFLGARTIASTMRELFGCVAFPHIDEADDMTFVCAAPLEGIEIANELSPSPPPTRVITRRRFARGSCVEMPLPDDAVADDLDNAPTRGHRTMHRMFNPLAA